MWGMKLFQPRSGRIEKLPPNTRGKDFVVGDVHGQLDNLRAHLRECQFDESTDRLFSVGDLIDRGPQSPDCIDLLNKRWFHACLGNHEWLFIQAYLQGDSDSAAVSLKNGGLWAEQHSAPQLEAWAKLMQQKMPLGIELSVNGQTVAITHNDVWQGDWQTMKDAASTKIIDRCVWSRARFHAAQAGSGFVRPIRSADLVISGHNPSERPVWAENQVFIDTHYRSGELTVLPIEELLTQQKESA